MYKQTWNADIGDELFCEIEEDNVYDKYAIKLMLKGDEECNVVGHIPIEMSKICYFFIKRGGSIEAVVTGKKFFGNGLEVPCKYIFTGSEVDVLKISKLLN